VNFCGQLCSSVNYLVCYCALSSINGLCGAKKETGASFHFCFSPSV